MPRPPGTARLRSGSARLRQVAAAAQYAGLGLLAVGTTFPFIWLLATSLRSTGTVVSFPPVLIPHPPTLANYAGIWATMPLARFFANTVYITGVGIVLTVVVSALAGYPLARMRFPGRDAIFYAIVGSLMLPQHVGLILNFVTLMRLHMVDTYAAVYLPSAASVFGIFLLRQAYLTIPAEIEDAARIDGAGEFRLWGQIMLPLVAPALATLAIIEFSGYWNSFLWPLIVLKSPEKFPLAVGLLYLSGLFAYNTRYIAAGAVLMTLPTIAVFLALQRYFLRGITIGAVK
ncbi:MAG: carbohydrate ABC transporter permease [Bacillati bacterium ANGP1]|uniref:Carbohydrate ABC transporter permease n=1 Tax=Candidatus Segetimicrobium genomatis TaxID=2569760 RepID=A0A537JTZ6_9BACT|nr:MAG: carbohydrate ABC transporter permease [Terrabacteria group bacterium ANGP1]